MDTGYSSPPFSGIGIVASGNTSKLLLSPNTAIISLCAWLFRSSKYTSRQRSALITKLSLLYHEPAATNHEVCAAGVLTDTEPWKPETPNHRWYHLTCLYASASHTLNPAKNPDTFKNKSLFCVEFAGYVAHGGKVMGYSKTTLRVSRR